MIQLPELFDYDTAVVKFRVDGADHSAVVRSMRTPEAQRAVKAFADSRKLSQETLTVTEEVTDDYGITEQVERQTELGKKLTARLCGGLVASTDCDKLPAVLLESSDLCDAIYHAAATLAADFAAKKKT